MYNARARMLAELVKQTHAHLAKTSEGSPTEEEHESPLQERAEETHIPPDPTEDPNTDVLHSFLTAGSKGPTGRKPAFGQPDVSDEEGVNNIPRKSFFGGKRK